MILANMDRERDPSALRFADLYHSAHRYLSSPPSHVPVVLPRTTLWDFEKSRLIVSSAAATIIVFRPAFDSTQAAVLRLRVLRQGNDVAAGTQLS